MIPLLLQLSGFLSYREMAEVDFSTFHLACISGANGAGKSTLLEAMTWALFGQGRRRDEALINAQSKTAEVAFTFLYEGNVYRVKRALTRGKTGTLEFQLAEGCEPEVSLSQQKLKWRPLTEHSTRETQARIEGVLRLDYETFINVSFFLQGRADQFAQQVPARRKEILGSILGLEAWERYRERAAEYRKEVENELEGLETRLAEIDLELGQETTRQEKLKQLQADLERQGSLRKEREISFEKLRLEQAAYEKQVELTRKLGEALGRERERLEQQIARLQKKQAERDGYSGLVARSAAIGAAYAAWEQAQQELGRWAEVAVRFHEHEKRRQPFLDEINKEKARLEQEAEGLERQAAGLSKQEADQARLEQARIAGQEGLAQAEQKVAERAALEAEKNASAERLAGLVSENNGLKPEMDEMKLRLTELQAVDGSVCPLCGQELSPEHRATTVEKLETEGKQKGDVWRANVAEMMTLKARREAIEADLKKIGWPEEERLKHASNLAQVNQSLDLLKKAVEEWEKVGARRRVEIAAALQGGEYAGAARSALAGVDEELASLGYDAAAHDTARAREEELRSAENERRELELAQAAMAPLGDEIAHLEAEIGKLEVEVGGQAQEVEQAQKVLDDRKDLAPDLKASEAAVFALKEEENRLNQEVGAARQQVEVLDDQRKQKKKVSKRQEEGRLQVSRYKALELAFGKSGVPALLIEQALPEIEAKANELLERLSGGEMSVQIVTQAAYKDKKRGDLKETLDIHISDGAGTREYEMFSGGEAFRVNFAIRLALSEVLASRKGARLQMLVIDEGFGSQDEQGRQRLIAAIRAVQDDFAKILVITHLEELKDAFPTRIEVEKGEGGSVVRVGA